MLRSDRPYPVDPGPEEPETYSLWYARGPLFREDQDRLTEWFRNLRMEGSLKITTIYKNKDG